MPLARKGYSEPGFLTLSSRTLLADLIYFRGSGHLSTGEEYRNDHVQIGHFPGAKVGAQGNTVSSEDILPKSCDLG